MERLAALSAPAKNSDKNISITDPSVRRELIEAIKLGTAGQVLMIIVMIICVDVLYGFCWNPVPYLKDNLKIAVVSADTGILDSALSQVVQQAPSLGLNYHFVTVSNKTHTFDDLKYKVDHGVYFAGLYLNQGSSQALMSALMNPASTGYQSSSAFSYVYDGTRDGPSYEIIIGFLGNSLPGLVGTFTKQALAMKFAATNTTLAQVNTQVLANPVGSTIVNLHPVHPYGLHTVIGSSMMQVYLVAMINMIAITKIHGDLQGKGINKFHLSVFLMLHRLLGCFIVALWPPITVNILFGTNILSASQFVSWWMLIWLLMYVFGSLVIWVVKLFGGPLAVILGLSLLMIQVASSTGSVPFDAMPDFYKIGLGLPFMNAVQASRAIVLGANEDALPRSIGVLFAWVGLFYVLSLLETLQVVSRVKDFIQWLFGHSIEKDRSAEQQQQQEQEQEQQAQEQQQSLPAQVSELITNRDEMKLSPITAASTTKEISYPPSPAALELPGLPASENLPTNLANDITAAMNQDEEQGNVHLQGSLREKPIGNNGLAIDAKIDNLVKTNESNNQETTDDLPLWHPSLAPLLVTTHKQLFGVEMFMSVFYLIMLLITYGCTVDPTAYHGNIKVAVLNADIPSPSSPMPPIVGSALSRVNAVFRAPFAFTMDVLDNTQYTFDDAQNLVSDGTYWGAIVVGPSASTQLYSSIANKDPTAIASYSATSPPTITYISDSGRGGGYMNNILKIWSSTYMGTYNTVVSSGLLLDGAAKKAKFSSYNTAALMQPVKSTNLELHPLPFSGIDGAVGGAHITLYLGLVIQTVIIMIAHDPLRHLGVRYDHRIFAKLLHLGGSAIILAFWPAIALAWYGYRMSGAMFFAYWAFMALGMSAFGAFAVMNYHVLGMALGGIGNIIIFSLNTASSRVSLPLTLMPSFFKIGVVLPYYHIVAGARAILFGTQAESLGVNVGVLISWVGFVFLMAWRLGIRRRRFYVVGVTAKHIVADCVSHTRGNSSNSNNPGFDIEAQNQDKGAGDVDVNNGNVAVLKPNIDVSEPPVNYDLNSSFAPRPRTDVSMTGQAQ